uniref:Uncharacterized protein n=1 Tax=Anguilla anguilla TaxID=7936 RepID=A0A0E9PYR9_ANGAN
MPCIISAERNTLTVHQHLNGFKKSVDNQNLSI